MDLSKILVPTTRGCILYGFILNARYDIRIMLHHNAFLYEYKGFLKQSGLHDYFFGTIDKNKVCIAIRRCFLNGFDFLPELKTRRYDGGPELNISGSINL